MPPSDATYKAVSAFRKLHESGCFVLPNPWDAGSAAFLESLGFRALASTSGGFAFSHGLPDSAAAVPLESVLSHLRELVLATSLPVSADFQNGFAREPEGVEKNVALCVETGVAGLSIEDATGEREQPLFETALAVERIRAARAAIDASGVPVVLTARCEAFLVGHPDAARVTLERLVAFAAAGADCLFAPGVRDLDMIREIVRAVQPKPVNALVSSHAPRITVSMLAEAGVRRVSVGSALARVAWGAFQRAARELLEQGSFDAFEGAAPFPELNGFFAERARQSAKLPGA